MPELVTTQAVSLAEELWYNALPIGKFYDHRYGEINITPELVTGLAANMGKAPSYPPPVKIGHGDGAPSPGVVKEAVAKADGLYLRMEVDDKAAKEIKDGRYRYMSAEYSPDYLDKITGKKIGAALLGVALVNQPAHPGVKPLFLSDSGSWTQDKESEKGGKDMDPEKLKELEAKIAALESEKKELADKAEEAKKLADGAVEEATKLKRERHEAEVKAFCDDWAAKGVPPVVVDKIKPVLLADGGGVIKLSDAKETDIKTLLGDIFEAIPKVSLRALGDPTAEKQIDAIKLGDDIAACANGPDEGGK
ncbi:phage protease [Dethiosulfovibrio salsuginis]|uniref:Mu-like prophage I protein n=1 Tax=Dethiosulfovibrio salsuginis TaxID=561720 RepID=A0A1X7LCZ3_9BACT|nr:phage protease [Dethiosulfovibrio salsuginis]SMG51711.1 Mu-like prophage I protein [Dethiosulfovibrio salsuginis]